MCPIILKAYVVNILIDAERGLTTNSQATRRNLLGWLHLHADLLKCGASHVATRTMGGVFTRRQRRRWTPCGVVAALRAAFPAEPFDAASLASADRKKATCSKKFAIRAKMRKMRENSAESQKSEAKLLAKVKKITPP